MSGEENYRKNESAFRKLKEEIDVRYPKGHLLALDEGQIVADAPTYEQLTESLKAAGKDPADIFVVQSGVDYPQRGIILPQ